MNHLLSLVPVARASSDPGRGLYADPMLAEVLALHEEMIRQLRLERREAAGSADFFTDMIDQHEKTAAVLRARLANHGTNAASEDTIFITGDASSDAKKTLVPRFTQGSAHRFALAQWSIHA